ncbi:MAG: M23 family metallopeptidase [Wenzhouxiangellaceae bacterium]|nr:M23 family metallopeptidase [Wenzhouxiangellaceae bacterium]
MRNQYRISISDHRGSRHFTLTQLMCRCGLAVGGTALTIFLGSLLVIQLLSNRVDHMDRDLAALQQRNLDIVAENQRLLAHQQQLDAQIERRAAELIAMTDDLEQLETLVGLNPPPTLPVAERLSVATHSALEKHLMLSSIPSGEPLSDAVITSRFGMREHPVIEKTRLHGGIDLRARIGTEVRATADGVVEFAGNNAGSGMGRMIKLVHNYGFVTIYAHLDQVDVEVGQYVRQNDVIGKSGNSGLTEAPHLHYEVRYLGRRLDPAPFLEWSLDRYQTVFEQEERVQWQSLARNIRNRIRALDPPSSRPLPSLSAISP